jgi:hypothetical protein
LLTQEFSFAIVDQNDHIQLIHVNTEATDQSTQIDKYLHKETT